jgi:integrase
MQNKFRYQLVRAKNRAGKLYPKWRIKLFEGRTYLSSEIGYTDKGRTEDKAKEMQRDLEHVRHLERVGAVVVQEKPLQELIEMRLGQLARKGGKQKHPASPQHVVQSRSKLAFWVQAFKATHPRDFNLVEAEDILAKSGLAVGTQDLYMVTLKSFCAWCVKAGYLAKNPLAGYQKHAPAPTFIRRALNVGEIDRLLAVTTDRRFLVYRLALLTGMRRGELDSLTVASVDWKAGKVHLEARHSKNRKEADFYLPDDFLAALYAFSAGKRLTEKLLVRVSPSKSAQTLHRDLGKAGIPIETHEGRVDFHSLRVTFLSLVNELGEDVKTVQEAARHSDPRLTFGTYAKTTQDRLKALVNRVHAKIYQPNRDIPRLPVRHAGVTQAPADSGTPDFIGSEAVGLGYLRADGHLKDNASQTETFPDINDIKAATRARFEAATKPAIPGHSKTEDESRRRHALASQVAESLSHLSAADLESILSAVRMLGQGRGVA